MISVALCTYNGEKFIKEQLESIIQQTRSPDEIIICDDVSTDNTVRVIHDVLTGWNGKKKIIINEKNMGFKKNFENAIRYCSGDIIFLSDQDDVWNSRKIEIIENAFAVHPNAIMVFHDAEIVDAQLHTKYSSFWKLLDFDDIKFKNDDSILKFRNVVQGSACAFRRELFDVATPFPMVAIHDEWLALIARTMGEIIAVPEILLKYRQSDSNAIGVIELTTLRRIKKYTLIIHRSLLIHYNELIRREKVFQEYTIKVKKLGVQTNSFMEYDALLKKQIRLIDTKNIRILFSLPSYIYAGIGVQNALKLYIKNVMLLILHIDP